MRALRTKSISSPLPGPEGIAHLLHGLRQRAHLVLKVGPDDPCTDRPPHGLPRVAVTGLQIGTDRPRTRGSICRDTA
ncbi:hypothetical protein ABIB26_004618 [Arthrobacter sp. UYEF20]